MDCREATRFFYVLNLETNLNVIISKNSSIINFKLDGQEIIVDKRMYDQKHEAWAIGDRPYQKMASLAWNCHVRGSELMLSASNGTSTLLYELTRSNELICVTKLKSIHLQHQATYINLNNAKCKAPIDGHFLVVRCNGNLNRIQAQPTKLLCHCNKSASILAQSLIGDIPLELRQHPTTNSFIPSDQFGSLDDLIICDAIFSLESTCSLDFLEAQLQYQNRIISYEVRSVQSTSSVTSQTNNVSSSTGSTSNSNINTANVADQSDNNCSSASTSTASPASHPSTVLRIRIRITNFGVCIMPYTMTNYTSKYKFSW